MKPMAGFGRQRAHLGLTVLAESLMTRFQITMRINRERLYVFWKRSRVTIGDRCNPGVLVAAAMLH